MSKLSIFTEVTAPLGGFDFMQATKLLGSPNLDDYSQFIRETAQNSWDARLDKESVSDVQFKVKIAAFTKAQAKTFANSIFTGDKKAEELIKQLHGHTSEGKPYVIVRDVGTVGLAGPTEANVKGDKRNFVSFVRNIGQDSHSNRDGGGYGFGKSVFFRFSNAKTLITYSHTIDEHGRAVTRLMGMTLNRDCFEHLHCTGRHWWGIKPTKPKADFNQPLTGAEADELAATIGFDPFGKGETGTAVMVIAPAFRTNDKRAITIDTPEGRRMTAEAIRESMVAWYWPRLMGSGNRDGKLLCIIECDGETINLPEIPEECPFKFYAFALEQIQNKLADPSFVHDPQTFLKEIKWKDESYGYLAIFKTNKEERPKFVSETLVGNHPLANLLWSSGDAPAMSNHVALVRGPGQVIRYVEMAACSRPSQEYGAVFFLQPTGPKAEEIILEVKNSEPAAHDDWIAVKSPRVGRIIQSIRGFVNQHVAPSSTQGIASSGRMGRVALALGALWGAGEAGGGNIDPPPPPPPPPPIGPPQGSLKFASRLFKFEGKKCILVEVAIPRNIGGKTHVKASVAARLLGGESSEIDDSQAGNVIGWFSYNEKEAAIMLLLSAKDELEITDNIRGKKVVLIIQNAENFGLLVDIKLN